MLQHQGRSCQGGEKSVIRDPTLSDPVFCVQWVTFFSKTWICVESVDLSQLQVRGLAEKQLFDLLVIESTGVSLPLPVAATFGLPPPLLLDGGGSLVSEGSGSHTPTVRSGSPDSSSSSPAAPTAPLVGLSDVARLDSLVTVVDAEVCNYGIGDDSRVRGGGGDG